MKLGFKEMSSQCRIIILLIQVSVKRKLKTLRSQINPLSRRLDSLRRASLILRTMAFERNLTSWENRAKSSEGSLEHLQSILLRIWDSKICNTGKHRSVSSKLSNKDLWIRIAHKRSWLKKIQIKDLLFTTLIGKKRKIKRGSDENP